MREIWKDIPEYKGYYQASNIGRIRSLKRKGRRNRYYGGLTTYGRNANHGYKRMMISINNIKKDKLVHDLVLLAFRGNPPKKHECAHLNGIRTDNRLCNLDWVTRSENQLHRNNHGTSNRGEQNGMSKLTREKVKEIRKRKFNGEIAKNIAKDFNVSISLIYHIVNYTNWKHI